MLPNLKESLRVAIDCRCNVMLIAAPNESSRQIEPYLVWESSQEGLLLLGRQTHGHSSANKKLPAWRKIKLKKVVQFSVLPTRFEPVGAAEYDTVKDVLKRKPLAAVDIDSPYTELSDIEHGPHLPEMTNRELLYGRG